MGHHMTAGFTHNRYHYRDNKWGGGFQKDTKAGKGSMPRLYAKKLHNTKYNS